MSKRVLKIVAYSWGAASRDRKELAIARELGSEIFVMVRGEPGDKGRHEVMHGFDVYNFTTKPLGNSKFMRLWPLRKFNTLLALCTWAHYARKFKADVITGHDYIALLIGWLSTLFIPKKRRPKLVYDSHEFELGRNKKRNKFQKWIVKRVEGFLIRRSVFTIIPNAVVADDLKRIYNLKRRPVVARNMPVYWQLDDELIKKRRMDFCNMLNLPQDSFIMMFHGGIMQNRGLEALIRIVKETSIPMVILGNPIEAAYLESLKELAADLACDDKILFLPAVPLCDLWQSVAAVNVGMITLPASCESYYHMLPNKFFENIQSLTPVITSNFPDISEIVNSYGIGLTVDPTDDDAIVQAIMRMRDDEELYTAFKANLIKAKEELCWEHEKKELYDAYKAILTD